MRVIEKVEKAMEFEEAETNMLKQKSNRNLHKDYNEIDPNNPNEVI